MVSFYTVETYKYLLLSLLNFIRLIESRNLEIYNNTITRVWMYSIILSDDHKILIQFLSPSYINQSRIIFDS